MNTPILNALKLCGFSSIFFVLNGCTTVTSTVPLGSEMTSSHLSHIGNDGYNYSGNSKEVISIKEITPQLVQSENALRKNRSNQDFLNLVAPPIPYSIGNGDVLSIVVWDHPELNTNANAQASNATENMPAGTSTAGFIVDNAGQIQFPYVGAIKVSGHTEESARMLLSEKLGRYFNKPNVTLRVQSYRSKRIYIDGEVKQPGVYPVNDIPMNLMEAINRTGGMLSTADQSRLTLSRDGLTYTLDLPKMVQNGDNPASILLKSGDVLRIQSREQNKVFVSGEVVVPRSLTMHNGRLSLNEALGESGGVNRLTGDVSQIYVIRRSSNSPVVYRLNAEVPGALAIAEAFELDPKDLVYVAATPLANWHRTISQIFPGALSSAISIATPIK